MEMDLGPGPGLVALALVVRGAWDKTPGRRGSLCRARYFSPCLLTLYLHSDIAIVGHGAVGYFDAAI